MPLAHTIRAFKFDQVQAVRPYCELFGQPFVLKTGMRRLAIVALMSVMAACGSKALPDPGSGATVITVTAHSPIVVTIRQGNLTKPLQLPGPITLDVGSALQLNLEELNGARAWGTPVSSNPEVLKLVSSRESAGYLVALFRGESPGTVSLQTSYPCSGTGCAAALFRLDIIVKSARAS